MTQPVSLAFTETDLEAIAGAEGRVALVLDPGRGLSALARRVNKLTRGAVLRLVESAGFADRAPGEIITLAWPQGLAAEALDIVLLPRRPEAALLRRTGGKLAKLSAEKGLLVLAGALQGVEDLALGLLLRGYAYDALKSQKAAPRGAVTVMGRVPDADPAALQALAEGIFFTRDLVNAPANLLTTTRFAEELLALRDLGITVEVLEEDQLEELGMGALLCVGQGSASPSKVVVMQWAGGTPGEAPLALVGKGVVFDTGGISLKPAGGMEDMTMDMGGAGTVAGTMKALALRRAPANVVGLVGLVENMPSGTAVRPGDVVTTMKRDTVEVINTDAEGRLVLCDVLWYAQERFQPKGVIDLATLTGACIVALGHENAGVFSNSDAFCNAFLKAAAAEGEGAWRLPLAPAYDQLLKSRVADMKNVGGRPAGSITAAQYLQRFVKPGTPWIHLDIAGVASLKSESDLAPTGATGWGVLALDRLVRDGFEG
ncbi:leucyl aminopeptidase [Pseudooceanicola sp. CBS1P-1]|uniref:Probable cytosol aminopeptidase n=1 Tax=Pseudooceanicola albus TaxID=2692189 RepID=A0A6L7FX80_9RHOB|nr:MULTISPECIES: leucyl aminopeptidase [Pseudooceanicola]MBT9383226.1 leucyl aminopeptidase [Pseudooceanicola endophyticus]MXN16451.1 leucyl aminopeptidase [Pseudooceanicola albus]